MQARRLARCVHGQSRESTLSYQTGPNAEKNGVLKFQHPYTRGKRCKIAVYHLRLIQTARNHHMCGHAVNQKIRKIRLAD